LVGHGALLSWCRNLKDISGLPLVGRSEFIENSLH
jgi:hypothetical protein